MKSTSIKNLFNENKQLIKNITGSRRNDLKLIRNVPIVYEAIETELNNYLEQPSWLNETTINTLKQLTSKLDKEFYSNEFLNQLQIGSLLKEIRLNLIENSLKLPNTDLKLGYMYVVGSDQFSALLNAINVYEQRPKFASSFIIELDDQANIRLNYYDAKTRNLIEKHVDCVQQGDGCKLVPFLKKLDQLIPIDVQRSCDLAKPRLIKSSGYDSLFKKTDDDNEDSSEDDESKEEDDTDLRKRERKEHRIEKVKEFIEKKFNVMINKNRELISWLSDLFMRRSERRSSKRRSRDEENDSEDDLKARLIEILQEKIKQIDNVEERKKLNELLNKWLGNQRESNYDYRNKNTQRSIVEHFENKIKTAIRDKELSKQKQKESLFKLIDGIKQFNQLNSLQRTEKMDDLKQKINETIKDTKLRYNEKLSNLKASVQEMMEDKFDQISNNFNQKKLKSVLNDIEFKFTDLLDERKRKRSQELNEIRNSMNELIDDNDGLIEIDKTKRLNEIKVKVTNCLDKEEKIDENKINNNQYLEVNKIIESLPNKNTIEFEREDATNNDEQFKVEKIKDKLKEIETNIVNYLANNKDNKKPIEEDLAKFNDYIQSNKKVSIGLLTRLSRLIDNEAIREEISDVIKNAINFVKLNDQNLITVETDLTTLINEIEETNRNVSSQQFDFNKYKNDLNATKPIKLLRAESPKLVELGEAPAFSPKGIIKIAIINHN